MARPERVGAASHRPSRQSYDAIAASYDEAIGDELNSKPLDRALLAALVERCSGGVVADLGCGPGHVAAELARGGVVALGVDLSPGMCRRALGRGVPSAAGDLVDLPLADSSLAGLVCWYALIHLTEEERAVAYDEMARVLAPGGTALVAFHTGDAEARPGDCRRLESWMGEPVELSFYFLDPAREIAAAEGAGLRLTARLDRLPAGGEHPSTRSYLLLELPEPPPSKSAA